jgi:two-component system alkaline phosphatase synthesis response regulator PhoP
MPRNWSDGRSSRVRRMPLSGDMDVMGPHAGQSVLVVDDEPQVVFVLQFSLEAEGYQTFTAHDGREALDQVRRHHPSLMVLDVMMPRMDGWAVLTEIAALPEQERPRIVMVTALAHERAHALAMGADGFVPKPFDVTELLGVLRDLEPQLAS